MSYISEILEDRGISPEIITDHLEDAKEKAEDILHDTKKTDKLINTAFKMCDRLSNLPIIGSIFSDLPYLCYMISDYTNGVYKEVPLATIIMATAGVIYVVSPIDLIPDPIPFIGQVDDAAVMTLVWQAIHQDIESYKYFFHNERSDHDI